MARRLELAELLEDDDVAEMDVGRGRVDAELDAQRAPLGQALLELAGGQHVDRPEGQAVRRFAALEAAVAASAQC